MYYLLVKMENLSRGFVDYVAAGGKGSDNHNCQNRAEADASSAFNRKRLGHGTLLPIFGCYNENCFFSRGEFFGNAEDPPAIFVCPCFSPYPIRRNRNSNFCFRLARSGNCWLISALALTVGKLSNCQNDRPAYSCRLNSGRGGDER